MFDELYNNLFDLNLALTDSLRDSVLKRKFEVERIKTIKKFIEVVESEYGHFLFPQLDEEYKDLFCETIKKVYKVSSEHIDDEEELVSKFLNSYKIGKTGFLFNKTNKFSEIRRYKGNRTKLLVNEEKHNMSKKIDKEESFVIKLIEFMTLNDNMPKALRQGLAIRIYNKIMPPHKSKDSLYKIFTIPVDFINLKDCLKIFFHRKGNTVIRELFLNDNLYAKYFNIISNMNLKMCNILEVVVNSDETEGYELTYNEDIMEEMGKVIMNDEVSKMKMVIDTGMVNNIDELNIYVNEAKGILTDVISLTEYFGELRNIFGNTYNERIQKYWIKNEYSKKTNDISYISDISVLKEEDRSLNIMIGKKTLKGKYKVNKYRKGEETPTFLTKGKDVYAADLDAYEILTNTTSDLSEVLKDNYKKVLSVGITNKKKDVQKEHFNINLGKEINIENQDDKEYVMCLNKKILVKSRKEKEIASREKELESKGVEL